MKKKRLWIFTNEYVPLIIGGLGTAVTNLAKAFYSLGIDVVVFTRGTNKKIQRDMEQGIEVIRYPLIPPYYNPATMQYNTRILLSQLQRMPLPDVIHIHSTQFIDLAIFFQRKHRIPILYTCHSLVALEEGSNSAAHKSILSLQMQLLKIANRISVPSQWEEQILHRLYPFSARKTIIIPHGVTKRAVVAARGPAHRLLFIGRVVPVKGIEALIHALAALQREGYHVTVDLVGTGPKDYTKYLQTVAKKLRVANKLRWLGYRTQAQIQQLYPFYGAVIMPSLHESFGLVALEALASGMPLIATQTGGLKDFISTNVAQIIARPNARAIVTAIKQFWKDKKYTNVRIANGKKLSKQYRWPQVGLQYRRLMQQMSESP